MKALIALALMVPMAANALCLGSKDTECTDVFRMVTNKGDFVRWESNHKGVVLKGRVSGPGLYCNITPSHIKGKIRIGKGGNIFGNVYYSCGTLAIVQMFSTDKVNWTARISDFLGNGMSGSVK